MRVTLYHNPRCSKSRATLELLRERGIEPRIVRYLETPPDRDELLDLLRMLGMQPRQLLRRGESVYRERGLDDTTLDEETLLQAMLEHPVLMERPIVVCEGRAVLGRPPENALEIL